MNQSELLKKLEKHTELVDAVVDTDMFNEIDDQFALAFILRLKEKINLQAIYAALFQNHYASNPDLGMELSYKETFHILDLLGESSYQAKTFRGSRSFLQDEQTPVESEAARDLVCRAMKRSTSEPLYIIAIAALTDVASAILMEPKIIERMVVIWHGGVALDWHDCHSFNAEQDIAATRVVMGSGVPMVLQPGRGVVDKLLTTGAELSLFLKGKNAFCDYMVKKTEEEARFFNQRKVWSRPLFDVAAVAWLLQDDDYMQDRIEHMPLISYDLSYNFDFRRHFVRYVYDVNRDAILNTLFAKLSGESI